MLVSVKTNHFFIDSESPGNFRNNLSGIAPLDDTVDMSVVLRVTNKLKELFRIHTKTFVF